MELHHQDYPDSQNPTQKQLKNLGCLDSLQILRILLFTLITPVAWNLMISTVTGKVQILPDGVSKMPVSPPRENWLNVSSVVKELIDNSLDAGSTLITVEVEKVVDMSFASSIMGQA